MSQLTTFELFRIACTSGIFAAVGGWFALRFGAPIDEWSKMVIRKLNLKEIVAETFNNEIAKIDARYRKLDNIVEEAKRVTLAAESIKSDMAQGNWDRQTMWMAKKELYFEVIHTLEKLDRRSMVLKKFNESSNERMDKELADRVTDYADAYFEMSALLNLSRLIAPSEISELLEQLNKEALHDTITSVERNVLIVNWKAKFLHLARIDLGIDWYVP